MKNRITWRAALALAQDCINDRLESGGMTPEEHGACLSVVCLGDTFDEAQLDSPVDGDDAEYEENGDLADEVDKDGIPTWGEPLGAAKYTDDQLRDHVCQARLDNSFGDGQERDMAWEGKAVFGDCIGDMTRQQLVEELESCGWFGDDDEFAVGDRVLVPAGTHIVVGNQEEETTGDTLATVRLVYDGYVSLLVDDVAVLPHIQREWNESEGMAENNAEIKAEYVSKESGE